jgi:conjugative transfer signal peptidase TraF
MSQYDIVLLFAIGGSTSATMSVALVTRRRNAAWVRWAVPLGLVFLMLLGDMVAAAGVRVNLTPSMPLGVYRVVAVKPHSVKKGMLVAVCAPAAAAEIARRSGHLMKGACAHDTEPLLKTVVAVGGDTVVVVASGVIADGRALENSTPLGEDRTDHSLTAWPMGWYRLPTGWLWLYANHRRSWDSRYWGPVSAGNVLAVVEPVLIVGELPDHGR